MITRRPQGTAFIRITDQITSQLNQDVSSVCFLPRLLDGVRIGLMFSCSTLFFSFFAAQFLRIHGD
jgi:hypothetical protein